MKISRGLKEALNKADDVIAWWIDNKGEKPSKVYLFKKHYAEFAKISEKVDAGELCNEFLIRSMTYRGIPVEEVKWK
jgi:hypothetical protein